MLLLSFVVRVAVATVAAAVADGNDVNVELQQRWPNEMQPPQCSDHADDGNVADANANDVRADADAGHASRQRHDDDDGAVAVETYRFDGNAVDAIESLNRWPLKRQH